MSIKDDLSSHLSAYTGLATLIKKRIYPIRAPQGMKDAHCVYTIIGDQRQYSHNGFSGLEEARIQISIYATTSPLAEQIKEQVIAAMEAWPAVNIKVQSCFQDNDQDKYISDVELIHLPVDFLIQYG